MGRLFFISRPIHSFTNLWKLEWIVACWLGYNQTLMHIYAHVCCNICKFCIAKCNVQVMWNAKYANITKPTKQCQHINQVYQTKPNEPNLPNQTYQIEPTWICFYWFLLLIAIFLTLRFSNCWFDFKAINAWVCSAQRRKNPKLSG